MKLFSCLDKDQKTYSHFLLYLTLIYNHENKISNNTILKVDNTVQKEELKKHLVLNNISNTNYVDEQLKWIKENSINMRKYLNSLKVCAMIYKDMDIKVSFENFQMVCDKLNADQSILTTIYI